MAKIHYEASRIMAALRTIGQWPGGEQIAVQVGEAIERLFDKRVGKREDETFETALQRLDSTDGETDQQNDERRLVPAIKFAVESLAAARSGAHLVHVLEGELAHLEEAGDWTRTVALRNERRLLVDQYGGLRPGEASTDALARLAASIDRREISPELISDLEELVAARTGVRPEEQVIDAFERLTEAPAGSRREAQIIGEIRTRGDSSWWLKPAWMNGAALEQWLPARDDHPLIPKRAGTIFDGGVGSLDDWQALLKALMVDPTMSTRLAAAISEVPPRKVHAMRHRIASATEDGLELLDRFINEAELAEGSGHAAAIAAGCRAQKVPKRARGRSRAFARARRGGQ